MRLYSGNSFDDAIFESPRLARVLKGYKRRLGLQCYVSGIGFECLCRAASLLCGLYVSDGRGDVALRRGVLKAADMFSGLMRPTVGKVLPLTSGIDLLDGSVDVLTLMGWCAGCWVVGADAYDCQLVFSDRRPVQQSVIRAYHSFDKLDATRYTSSDIVVLYLSDVLNNTTDKETGDCHHE